MPSAPQASQSAAHDALASESARRLAEATRARLRNLQVAGQAGARQVFHAPASGVVLEKMAVEGGRFMPGEALFRIADLSRVWIIADVYEQDLARVQVGQGAQITLDAWPGRSLAARVGYLYPTLDTATRSTRVRLELDKLVKARKEAIRAEIVAAGQKALQEHVAALNARIGRPLMPAVHADFAAAIKGKRTIDSLRGAVDDTLAQAKIDANAIADRISINLCALDEHKEHAGLFPDVGPLVLKQPDDLAAVVAQRIAEHEAREQARRQAEEEAKVRAAAEQARQQAEAAKVAEPAPVAQTAPQSQPAQTAPSLTVSQINARLGFVVTADFLQALGFEATQQGTRKLYYPEQFQSICQAIARHVTRIAQE